MRRAMAVGRESSVDPAGVTRYTIPATVYGSYSLIAYTSMWVDGDELLCLTVNENRKLQLHRKLWCRQFEATRDLSIATGTVFGSAFTQDSHNVSAIAKSSDGITHIAGDMHAVAMKYMRTVTPGDYTSWTTGMVGTLEASMTYPQFVLAKSGILYFVYRDGSSGDGDWVLNKWSVATGAWSRVAVILQGSVENVSAYPQNIAVNYTTGRWHWIWTVRKDFSSEAENENIYAAYSDDEGVTWKKYSDGSSYTLPITFASGQVVQTIVGGAGGGPILKNGGSTAVDTNGRPQSVWLLESGVGTGVYHYKLLVWDGAAWQWTSPFGTTNSSGRAPSLHIWPDGRRWMFFQNGAGGRANTLRYYDLDAQTETVIYDHNMVRHTPAHYYAKGRGVVYLLAPSEEQDGGGDPALASQTDVPLLAIGGAL